MKYNYRICENEIEEKLSISGAVLLDGPKACGKTETGKRFAKSTLNVDIDPMVRQFMTIDPQRLLKGETPRLLDEWQEETKLWDIVRHEIDDRQKFNQFILTGSSTPEEGVRKHSGAGRITRIKMRPMSLLEQGHSSGKVSLAELFSNDKLNLDDSSSLNYKEIIKRIVIGGWPRLLGTREKEAVLLNEAYVDMLTEVDMSRISDSKSNPEKAKALLKSYSRNIATLSDMTTIVNDVAQDSGTISRPTAYDYINALTRLNIIEDLPQFNVHIRSSAQLRKAQKRHFVDPSIAVASLGLNTEKLYENPCFVGYLFESLVVRDLRVYAQTFGAKVYHYHDSVDDEVDAIVQKRSGEFIACEIKLNPDRIEDAVRSLNRFRDKIADGSKKPMTLNVITAFGEAYTRPDGINIIPIGCLGV